MRSPAASKLVSLLVGLALVASGLVLVSRAASAASYAPAPPCPTGWTCVDMPCPTPGQCGTVQVGPTSNLGVDQWIFVRLYGFNPADTVGTYYCQDTGSLSPSPACALDGTALLSYPSTVVKPFKDGTSAFGFNVPLVDPASGTPLSGGVPPSPPTTETFYCTQDDHCAVEVASRYLSPGHGSMVPGPTNAVRIPLTFAPSNSGCPSGTIISTESEFGIERLFPRVSSYLCSGKDPAVPFNTAINGKEAVSALAAGSVPVAFTDDPNSASQQALLKKGNYILVPIVSSANVLAFKSQISDGFTVYPKGDLAVSANMAAGVISGAYQAPTSADIAPCIGACPTPPHGPCFNATSCSFFTRMNNAPGFFTTKAYGSYPRSDASGSTSQLFSWICAMQKASADLGGMTTETQTGAEVLMQGLATGTGTSVTSCPSTDQFPPLQISGDMFSAVNSPSQQAIKMTKFVPPFQIATADTTAMGFAPMNWVEARYYGMSTASLQNAAGTFVAPSAASINAALADGTWNANGTLSPSYANGSNGAAYAMPTVIYAAVNQSPKVPKATQAAIRTMLTRILDVTTGAHGEMPEGFVPLNADLATLARDEVAHAIGNPYYVIKVPQKPTTLPTTPVNAVQPATSSAASLAARGQVSASERGAGAAAKVPSSSPTYKPFMVSSVSGVGTTGAMAAGMAAVLLGSLLMAWRPLRRKLMSVGDAELIGLEGEDLG